MHPRAGMNSIAEADVLGNATADVERIGMIPFAFVTIG